MTMPKKNQTTEKENKVLVALSEVESADTDKIVSQTKLSESDVIAAIESLKQKGFIEGPPSLHERVAAELKNIDPDLKCTDKAYSEAIILLASALTKADEKWLSDNLGFDHEFVNLVGNRLRNCRVWVGDAVNLEVLKAWQEQPVSFFIDVNVASGTFVTTGTGESRQISLTESGQRDADNLLKGMKKP